MKKIVISQPMFFPWVGIFEQLRICDEFVYYDDVQMPQGRSFITRVQIKTSQGIQWLTVPIKRNGIQTIKDVELDNSQSWRENHLRVIKHNYSRAPYFEDMFSIVNEIYGRDYTLLCDLNCATMEETARYFSLKIPQRKSSVMNFTTRSTQHLLDIVKFLEGTVYITGHGARNYMDHSLFEKNGIDVRYMLYNLTEYNQMHGGFTPFVSILDLIANVGKKGVSILCSGSEDWKTFVDNPQEFK